MSMPIPAPRCAFLLGAGASVEAGLPTLQALSTGFLAQLATRQPLLHDSLVRLCHIDAGGSTSAGLPDAESLLGLLERVSEWHTPALQAERRDAAVLQHELRKFIWTTLARHGPLGYLAPLQKILAIRRPLEIFTLNNDMVIEAWCRHHHLRYCDGFDARGAWDIRTFDDPDVTVKLHKLHGSINWYRDQDTDLLARAASGSRVSLAMRVARTAVPDVALLFPAHSKDILQPALLELFHLFLRRLSEIDVLVVIGCSLRDLHLSRAIRQSLFANPKLHLLLVDPNPGSTAAVQITRELPQLESRVHCMEATCGAFLQGDLEKTLETLVCGHRDEKELLEHALARMTQPEGAELLRSVARTLSARLALSRVERAQLATSLRGSRPLPAEVESPLDPVFALLQNPASLQKLPQHLQQAADLLHDYRAPSCFGIHLQGDDLFVISGHTGRLLRYDVKTWQSREAGPPFTNARGLAVADGIAYVVQCWFWGIEGAGVLYAVDLRSQKRWRVFPPAWFMGNLMDRFARAQSASSLISKIRDLAGLLNWPSSIRPLTDRRKVCVVEARRLRILDPASGRTLALSPPRFFNLVDAVEWNYPELILLESARAGGGNISWYHLELDQLETIIMGITAASGIALLPNRKDLLYTEGLPRPGGRLHLVRNFQSTPQPRLVLDRLNKPRHIAVSPQGAVYLASRDGVLRLKPGVID
ncbi:MAG: SIR2 family protein [candidate division KSB1 bacterium]|nr:SIR2 family protein [candidate division KSB1 bacterium]MDZ7300451.1 SIR2 family protein [candidate division KSB1 bacterium]MDZ7308629.1 SIR2 family protein [candidate division KSB1 bacterium]MDZ7351447.1 SIR2 family protein [candidate division KSB1 bacterium]MDZ7355806.1 SIR2 family protein [candidate division KSB1 bacterium]